MATAAAVVTATSVLMRTANKVTGYTTAELALHLLHLLVLANTAAALPLLSCNSAY
jgi:hypothetical protein